MAEVELRLTADTDGATKGVTDFRRKFEEMVRTIEKPLRQVNGLRDLEKTLEETGRKTLAARDRVRDLGNELARTASPSRELNATYKEAVNELNRLERAEDAARQGIVKRRRELQAAGVDVRNLAAEQRRLRAEMAQATGGVRAEGALTGAMGDLGISQYRRLQSEIGRVRQQYELLKGSGRVTANELSIAHRTMTQRIRENQRALRDLNAEQARARAGSGAGGLVAPIAAAYGGLRALTGVTRQTDQWVELTDRIKLASNSQEEYEKGLESLRAMSDRTFTSMTNNAEIYIGSLTQLRERGFSSNDALKFTETLGLGLVASAAKGDRAVSVINQFNAALQDGVLKGDAFNTMVRNTPALADAMARGLGKTREELAAMAKAGELTTDVFVPALISQIDSLGKAVDDMTVTGGDGFVRVMNAWQEAVGKADLKPFTDSLNGLAKTLRDPAVADAITFLSGLILKIGAIAVSSVSDFGRVGQDIGVFVAKLTGSVDALSDVEREIASVDAAINGWGVGDLLTRAIYTEDEIKQRRADLEAEKQKIIEGLGGLNAELEFLGEVAAAAAEAGRERDLSNYRSYIGELKKLQDQQVKAAADAVKKQAAAEKAALRDVEKVKTDRLRIEERYQQALAGLSGGVGSTFGDAQDLKVAAKQALARGDISTAQAQAQAALKILTDLAAAGENTYGFAGFIKELQGIELAANDIEQSQADQKLEDIRQKMADLEAEAKKLEGMPVSVTADEASIEAVRTQIQALIDSMQQKGIVLPVSIANPNLPADGAAAPSPGFAEGGWTGPGSKYKPAGVVHADEHVMPKRVVNEPGALSFLEQVRRDGFKNTMGRFHGYAEGGLVTPTRTLPSIPQPSQALLDRAAGPDYPDLGSVNFNMPGGDSFTAYMPSSEARRLQRLASKFGRPQ